MVCTDDRKDRKLTALWYRVEAIKCRGGGQMWDIVERKAACWSSHVAIGHTRKGMVKMPPLTSHTVDQDG